MSGWKTWTGVGLYVASAALDYLESAGICAGCSTVARLIEQVGQGFFGIGVAHKLEKAARLIAGK